MLQPYDIFFSERARQDLAELPRETALKALRQIHNVAEMIQRRSPQQLSRLWQIAGAWKSYIIVEDYWILYTVDHERKVVSVAAVTDQPHSLESSAREAGGSLE